MRRLAYHEHPSYVPLLLRAHKLWQELQTESGQVCVRAAALHHHHRRLTDVCPQEVMRITGSVEAADASEPAEHSVYATALESCRQYGLRHESLSGQQCNERWPGYRLPHSFQVSWR